MLLRYIIQDTINRRAGSEVFAGILAIAIASFITILCLSFSTAADRIINKAINTTRPRAGVVMVQVSKDQGRFFTLKEKEALKRILAKKAIAEQHDDVSFELHGQIESDTDGKWPSLQSFDRDESVAEPIVGEPRIWMVRNDSFLFREESGFNMLHETTKWIDTEPLSLGVLVNLKFFERYEGKFDDNRFNEFREDKSTLPTYLLVDVPPITLENKQNGLGQQYIRIPISGYFDEPDIAVDLIVSRDIAAVYFYQEQGADGFKAEFLPHYYFQVHDNSDAPQPLIGLPEGWSYEDVQREYPILGSPEQVRECGNLRRLGLWEYDNVRVFVRDWKEPGARERLRKALQDVWFDVALKKQPENAIAFCRILREKRDRLYLAKEIDLEGEPLSDDIKITPRDVSKADESFFIVEYSGEKRRFILHRNGDSLSMKQQVGWDTELEDIQSTTALIRVRQAVQVYSWGVIVIVFLLGLAAVFLLAVCHVLRKQRDIGLLYSNGASSQTIFAVFLGEMILLGITGFMLGTLLASFIAPCLSGIARAALTAFSTALEGREGVDRLLSVAPSMIAYSLILILFFVILGALIPAYRATRTDPLTSIATG